MINACGADQAVLDAVMNRVLTLDFFSDLVEETRSLLSDTAALDREIEGIEKNLAENDIAIRNLLDLAETFGALSAGERLREREGVKVRLDLALRKLESKRKTSTSELVPEALPWPWKPGASMACRISSAQYSRLRAWPVISLSRPISTNFST